MIEGLLALMEHPHQPGPVNLGGTEEVRLVDLAQNILALTGSRSVIEIKPRRPDDPMMRRPDTAIAQRLLKWNPSTSLSVGLKTLLGDIVTKA
jgi:nucleoside-diphosphate-sugar epimerase